MVKPQRRKIWIFIVMILTAGIAGEAIDLWNRNSLTNTTFPTFPNDLINLTGNARVGGKLICLADGTNCQAVASAGNINISNVTNLVGVDFCPSGQFVINLTVNDSGLFSLCETPPATGGAYPLFNVSDMFFNASSIWNVNRSWQIRDNLSIAAQLAIHDSNNVTIASQMSTMRTTQSNDNTTVSGIQSRDNTTTATQLATKATGTAFKNITLLTSNVQSVSATAYTTAFYINLTTGKAVIYDCDLIINASLGNVGTQTQIIMTGTSSQSTLMTYNSPALICASYTATNTCSPTTGLATPSWLKVTGNSIQSSNGIFNLSVRSETGGEVNILRGSVCKTIEMS